MTAPATRLASISQKRLSAGSRAPAAPVLAVSAFFSVRVAFAAIAGTVPALAHEVYVSNEKDNSISVIDTRSLDVVRTFKVGQRPRGITFSRDYKTFYVCASDSDAVQVFDAATDKHLYDLPSGDDPEQFAVSPDNSRLYIANEDNAVTTVIDLTQRKVIRQVDVGIEPEGIAVSPDNKIAIATSETTNMAHFIDTESFEVYDNVLVDARPRHAEFTQDGKLLWVSSEIGGSVSVIDVATRKVIKTITFTIPGVRADMVQPVGMTLAKNDTLAFVALGPANRVAVVDARSYEVLKYILVGQRVWHMAMTPEEDLLFTTNGVTNDVTVIDVARLAAGGASFLGSFFRGAPLQPKK